MTTVVDVRLDRYLGALLESFTQDANEVCAKVRNTKTDLLEDFWASFLIGADGARSVVRDAIGAKMVGEYGLSRNFYVVFRAPGLAEAHAHGPAIMYWQINGDTPSLIGPMDAGDKWFFMPTNVAKDVTLSSDEAADLIRKATGINLPYEILSTDEWIASRLVADRYRDRRVFLTGDACHLHPPFGGYGINMGVADGVDLGWKLAAVLQGWGGEPLLGNYETERRPVHTFVMDEAVANRSVLGAQLFQPGMESTSEEGAQIRERAGEQIRSAKAREFHNLSVVLGYRYDDSAIVVPDGSEQIPHDSDRFVPSARPGCLAPHAWLDDGSSLYDCFGQGFGMW